jgi:uncharacterized protein YndB with AHSA1/START domain
MSAAPATTSTTSTPSISSTVPNDPQLDLIIARDVKASPSVVWRLLTEPQHLKEWWAPKPWKTVECEVDLRPGGIFRFDMRSPDDSEASNNLCCILEVVKEERLVWTNALVPNFRPAAGPSFVPFFAAVFTLRAEGNGTHYTARVMHSDEAGRDRHVELGFYDGWGTVTNQMIERAEQVSAE